VSTFSQQPNSCIEEQIRAFDALILFPWLNTLKGRFMDLLDNKRDIDLIEALLPEVAKAQNEIRCARNDLEKATNRLSFILLIVNKLIGRQEIER